MTYKNGFCAGAIIGAICWLYYYGLIPFLPVIFFFQVIIYSAGLLLSLVSLAFLFITAFKRSSVIDTTVDGAIYGFIGSFELLFVVSQLYLGKMPFSMFVMYL
jgi:hypothetical protein